MQDIIDLEYVCQLWVADELAIPLLRKANEQVNRLENVIETHTVHHRIPLVPGFILDVDSRAKSITVKLPSGLIKLGREELYVRVLKRELEPYIANLPNKFREKVRGERELPRYKDLRQQGRPDLVSLIKKAGGLAKVRSVDNLSMVFLDVFMSIYCDAMVGHDVRLVCSCTGGTNSRLPSGISCQRLLPRP